MIADGNLTVTGTSRLGTVDQIIYTNNSAVPINGSTNGYRSEGTKIVLYDSFSYYQNDFAIGIEPYNMFLLLQKQPRMGLNFMVILPAVLQ